MRRTVLTFLGCLLLFGWRCSESGDHTDNTYKGRVRAMHQLDALGKPVVVTTMFYDDEGHRIREYTRDSSQSGVSEREIRRDYDGDRLIRLTAFDPPESLDYYWAFDYDDRGHLHRETGRLSNDSIFEAITYVRNPEGRIIEEIRKQWNQMTRTHFAYDSQWRLITAEQFGPDGALAMTNTYIYGSDTLADTVLFIPSFGPTRTMVYAYDAADRKIAEKELREDGSVRLVRQLAYDLSGHVLFDEDFLSGNRKDYLYVDGHLTEERHKVRGGKPVGIVYYE